ncbi:MAG: hypothetical protein FWF31_03110, partial [Desulfobulbus sp.]|nr:hypothetical protein [Desulfobulbus sp.]
PWPHRSETGGREWAIILLVGGRRSLVVRSFLGGREASIPSQIYKLRWQTEKFFAWWKREHHHLHLSTNYLASR